MMAVQDCLLRAKGAYDWVAHIDVDEYLRVAPLPLAFSASRARGVGAAGGAAAMDAPAEVGGAATMSAHLRAAERVDTSAIVLTAWEAANNLLKNASAPWAMEAWLHGVVAPHEHKTIWRTARQHSACCHGPGTGRHERPPLRADVAALRYVHYKEASRISTASPLPVDRGYADAQWERDGAMQSAYLARLRAHALFAAFGEPELRCGSRSPPHGKCAALPRHLWSTAVGDVERSAGGSEGAGLRRSARPCVEVDAAPRTSEGAGFGSEAAKQRRAARVSEERCRASLRALYADLDA